MSYRKNSEDCLINSTPKKKKKFEKERIDALSFVFSDYIRSHISHPRSRISELFQKMTWHQFPNHMVLYTLVRAFSNDVVTVDSTKIVQTRFSTVQGVSSFAESRCVGVVAWETPKLFSSSVKTYSKHFYFVNDYWRFSYHTDARNSGFGVWGVP